MRMLAPRGPRVVRSAGSAEAMPLPQVMADALGYGPPQRGTLVVQTTTPGLRVSADNGGWIDRPGDGVQLPVGIRGIYAEAPGCQGRSYSARILPGGTTVLRIDLKRTEALYPAPTPLSPPVATPQPTKASRLGGGPSATPRATVKPGAGLEPVQNPHDPQRLARAGQMYAALSDELRAGINDLFGTRPQTPANNAAWCALVEQVYQSGQLPARAPSGRIQPAGRIISGPTTQAACFAAHPLATWDSARRVCEVAAWADGPTPTLGSVPTQPPGGGSGTATSQWGDRTFADEAACTAAGGRPFESKGGNFCGNEAGDTAVIGAGGGGAAEADHTDVIVGGIVQGAVGIAGAVAAIINGNNQREYQQMMAGLQSEQNRLALAARAGDNESAQAVARIQLAIAQLNQQAADANARAAAANQPPPFQIQQTQTIPTWAWVTGGVVLAAAIAALVVAVTRSTTPAAPQQYAQPYGAPQYPQQPNQQLQQQR